MKIENVYEEIIRLDSSNFIESLDYQGINLWPLLRYHLLLRFKDGEGYFNVKPTEIKYSINWIQRIKLNRQASSERRKFKKCRSEIVFLDEYLYNTDRIDGNIYNRHVQPYYEITSTFSKSIILAFQDELKNKKGVQYFNPWYFLFQSGSIAEFDTAVMDRFQVRINKKLFIHHAKMLLLWRNYFHHFFKNSSTRIILFPNFYDVINFGLIAACKDLKIKTVDLQHGKQGKYHPIYYGWNYFPKNGFSILPDYFWVWGDYFKAIIEEGVNNVSFPKIISGGNAWLMREKEEKFDKTRIPAKFTNEKAKNILIGLQPVETEFTLNFIKSLAINGTNLNIILRFHPVMQKDKAIYEKSLSGFSNIDFETGNKLKLVELFNFCHAVATPWSTIALEGIEFGLRPYIIHPNGKSIFKDDIESGLLFYFDDPIQLYNHFCLSSETKDGVINSDRDKITLALKEIVS